MLNLLRKKQTSTNNTNKDIIISQNNKIYPSNTQVMLSSPSWKEWSNSVYCYNKDYTKLLVHKDKLVDYLFKSYSNLTKKILQLKRKRFNPNRFSSNKLFLSKAEIKHTNTNVNITLFLFNKNKNYMKYKLTSLQTKLYKDRKFKWDAIRNRLVKVFVFNAKQFKSSIYRQINIFYIHIMKNITTRMNIFHNISKYENINSNIKKIMLKTIKVNAIEEEKKENYWRNLFLFYINKNKKLVITNFKSRKTNKISITDNKINKLISNLNLSFINNFNINNINANIFKYLKPLTILKKDKNFKIFKFLYYYQMLMFNKNKFTNWFLNYRGFGLINIISKIYNKKVEFNIVNLKSMHLNSDIYSEAIALKLRNRKNKLLRVLKKALFKIKLPRLFDLCNIDKNTSRLILRKKDVLNSLRYKLISGVRFEASGRLTRRLIASRAVFKFRYVGSLKNIYSSFVGLPSVMLRGYLKSNIQYTMINSKTRNGAFGLKGWTSSY